MNRAFIILASFLCFLLVSCKWNNVAVLEGQITQATDKKLYVEKFNLGNSRLIDSVKLNNKGKFRFKLKTDYPEYYILKFNDKKFITLLIHPEDKVTLNATYDEFVENYNVEGSEQSRAIQQLNKRFMKAKIRLDSISRQYKKYKDDPDFSSKKNTLEKTYAKILQEEKKFISDYIKNIQPPMVSYFALYQQLISQHTTPSETKEMLLLCRIVATALQAKYPGSPYTKSILSEAKRLQKIVANQKIKSLIKESGSKLPDLKLINARGDSVMLSDFKRRTILIAFWSYRDNRSFNQNSAYKKIYKKYKKRGFVIYHINVDANTDSWRERVKTHAYPFVNVHDTPDLMAMKIFNIRQLPANYLIDKNKNFVGKNLFGMYLDEKLNELLK